MLHKNPENEGLIHETYLERQKPRSSFARSCSIVVTRPHESASDVKLTTAVMVVLYYLLFLTEIPRITDYLLHTGTIHVCLLTLPEAIWKHTREILLGGRCSLIRDSSISISCVQLKLFTARNFLRRRSGQSDCRIVNWGPAGSRLATVSVTKNDLFPVKCHWPAHFPQPRQQTVWLRILTAASVTSPKQRRSPLHQTANTLELHTVSCYRITENRPN